MMLFVLIPMFTADNGNGNFNFSIALSTAPLPDREHGTYLQTNTE